MNSSKSNRFKSNHNRFWSVSTLCGNVILHSDSFSYTIPVDEFIEFHEKLSVDGILSVKCGDYIVDTVIKILPTGKRRIFVDKAFCISMVSPNDSVKWKIYPQLPVVNLTRLKNTL